jgi:hypothetical protein
MKMDTLFWLQRNPKLTVEHTTKKYFGKYLYKLVLYAPASRLIHSKGSIDEELQHRKNFNHGGSWKYKNYFANSADMANVEFLEKMRDLKHDKTLNIKLRAEEPRIQVYADNEQDLKHIINTYLSNYYTQIETISGPEDADAEQILNSGAILKKNDFGYRYKVILKDGRYDTAVKRQLAEYLENLGVDLVRIPRGTYDMLSKPTSYMWSCYFYSNDDRLNVFVDLMIPGIISNCHELVLKPHK